MLTLMFQWGLAAAPGGGGFDLEGDWQVVSRRRRHGRRRPVEIVIRMPREKDEDEK